MILVYDLDWVRISGIKIDGNDANQSNNWQYTIQIAAGSDYSQVDNIWMTGSPENGVFIDSSYYATIRDSVFKDNPCDSADGSAAIYLEGAGHNLSNLHIEGSPTGIGIWADEINSNININNVYFRNITKPQKSAIHGEFVQGININNITIDETLYTNQGVNGIFLTGRGDPLYANISNVMMRNIGGVGIEIQDDYANIVNVDMSLYNGGGSTSADQNGMYLSASHINVSNFRIHNSYHDGIYLGSATNVKFLNGLITDSKENGITLDATWGAVSDVTIQNVKITGSDLYGIDETGDVTDIKMINMEYSDNTSGNVESAVVRGTIDIDADIYTSQDLTVDGVIYGATMELDGTGNVGIGTSSPTHKLDVVGQLGVDGSIYFDDITNGYALCVMATTKQLGHCTDTPTGGACTCTPN
jgi:hypothetical protein